MTSVIVREDKTTASFTNLQIGIQGGRTDFRATRTEMWQYSAF